GCSSCPPADALLEHLDRTQPIAGAQIIVVGEHVDYWDDLGWKDRFASAAFTARQQSYARRFGISGPYTPQMVVDGRVEFVGNDRGVAQNAIRQSIREPKTAVRIAPAASGNGRVTVEVDALAKGKNHKANVFVAYVDEKGDTDVARGENHGRKLHHV